MTDSSAFFLLVINSHAYRYNNLVKYNWVRKKTSTFNFIFLPKFGNRILKFANVKTLY